MSSPIESQPVSGGIRRLVLPLTVLTITAATAGAAFFAGQNRTSDRAPSVPVQLVQAYPHDPGAFCQGLVIHKGRLLEGTGQYNESRLRLVDIASGKPVYQVDLPGDVFGEGVTVWKDTNITPKNNRNSNLKSKGKSLFLLLNPASILLKIPGNGFYSSQGRAISNSTFFHHFQNFACSVVPMFNGLDSRKDCAAHPFFGCCVCNDKAPAAASHSNHCFKFFDRERWLG